MNGVQLLQSVSGAGMMPSGSGCAARENAAGRLSAALARLTDRQRAMIYLTRLGRSTPQIAAELGTDDDVVKTELHHALHALRMTLCSGGGTPSRRT